MCNHELKRLFYTSDDYGIQSCRVELEKEDDKYTLCYCEKCGQVFLMEIAKTHTEPDRKAIEDEVWRIARLIVLEADDGGLNPSELYRCFGNSSIQDVMKIHSYQEAKAKYEEWKKQKNEIRVGDEVEYECCDELVRFIVTGFCGETAFGFKHQCDYDDVGEYCKIEDLRKTGRSFPEIANALKKMGDEK